MNPPLADGLTSESNCKGASCDFEAMLVLRLAFGALCACQVLSFMPQPAAWLTAPRAVA